MRKHNLVTRSQRIDVVADGAHGDGRRYYSSPSLNQLDGEDSAAMVTGKPAAVAQAMRVLEVHERIERPVAEQLASGDGDVMAEEDKALLRNFCNVSLGCNVTAL